MRASVLWHEEMQIVGAGGRTLNGNNAEGATGFEASGQLRVYVKDPSVGFSDGSPLAMSGFPWFGNGARSVEKVVGHEFGHALEYMMQRMIGHRPNAVATDASALNRENRVRRLRAPNAISRMAH